MPMTALKLFRRICSRRRPSARSSVRDAVDQQPPIALVEFPRQRNKVVPADPTVEIGDLLRRRDELALAGLQHADKFGRLEQRVESAGVEPGVTSPDALDLELL